MQVKATELRQLQRGLTSKTWQKRKAPMFKLDNARRIKKIEDYLEDVTKIAQPEPQYKEYMQEREKLQSKYAQKEKGKELKERTMQGMIPKINPVKRKVYEKEHQELIKKYQKAIDERKEYIEQLDDQMQEKKIDLNISPIIKADIHNFVTLQDMMDLWPIYQDKQPKKSIKTKKVKWPKGLITGDRTSMMPGLSPRLGAMGQAVDLNFIIPMGRNRIRIEELAKKLMEEKPYKDYMEKYEEKRGELAEQHSKKDANGDIQYQQTERGMEYVFEDKVAFDDEFQKLREKNKKVIEDYQKWLDQEVPIEIETFDENILPKIYLDDDDAKESEAEPRKFMTEQAAEVLIYFLNE